MQLPRRLAITVRWLVGLGIVFYLSSTIELRSVFRSISAAEVSWLLVGLAMALLNRCLVSLQLTVALRHSGLHLRWTRAFVVNSIAAFYSLFLPGQLTAGAVKWYKLSKGSGQGPEVFATILLLRIITSLVVLIFGAAAALLDESLGLKGVSGIGLGLAAIAIAFLFAISSQRVLLVLKRHQGSESARPIGRWTLKLVTAIRRSRDLSWRPASVILLVPFICHFVTATMFFSTASSMDLQIPFVSQLWLVSLVYFISLVPATVSGLGLREGALMYLLPHYGIERVDALAFSLLIFGYSLAFGLLGGVFEAWDSLFKPLRQTRSILPNHRGESE